jgi:pyruvate,water dikinase
MGLTVARLAADARRSETEVDRFDRNAEQQRRWLAELDLAILPDDALKTTLREGREFFAMAAKLWFDCAATLAATHTELLALFDRHDRAAALRAVLGIAAGIGDLETVKPGRAFGHVLEIARRDPEAAAWLLANEGTEWRALPEGATRRAFSQMLEAYGDRALGEGELTTPRWSEDAGYWLRDLAIGLRGPPVDPDQALSLARATADRELALHEARLSFVEVRLLRELTTRLREAARVRSRMHVRLGHAAAMLRTIVRDVDRRLRRLDPTLPSNAAFHCTFDELVGAVGSYRADLGPLVRARVDQRLADARLADPPATFVGSPPRVIPLPADIHNWRGLGASAGTAEGRVRPIDGLGRGLDRFERGDILVVSSLDPGHAPLLLLAGGAVAERGSAWSEGVVVARELGVPVVVGGALAYLAQGERVRIDGSAGSLERLDR